MITVAFPDISLGVTFPEKAPGFVVGVSALVQTRWVDQADVVNFWLHTWQSKCYFSESLVTLK